MGVHAADSRGFFFLSEQSICSAVKLSKVTWLGSSRRSADFGPPHTCRTPPES